uniref:Capsid protein n=1 Tax=Peony betaflexivirus 1 TaxID=2800951 RepID=A0A7L7QTM6_9VIRU|nr:coat protein [Peony betaflexivirus 1]
MNQTELDAKRDEEQKKNNNKAVSIFDELSSFDCEKYVASDDSNKIATKGDILRIRDDLISLKIPENQISKAMIDIAWHCRDVGSSGQAKLIGKCSAFKGVTREQIGSIIKKHTTLRQFCAFLAPIVWNIGLRQMRPPAAWNSLGFKESAKYAAFDFFYGVEHEGAQKVKEGLKRAPTNEERAANQTSKMISLHRQLVKEGTSVMTVGEVTGGRFGHKHTLDLYGGEN